MGVVEKQKEEEGWGKMALNIATFSEKTAKCEVGASPWGKYIRGGFIFFLRMGRDDWIGVFLFSFFGLAKILKVFFSSSRPMRKRLWGFFRF